MANVRTTIVRGKVCVRQVLHITNLVGGDETSCGTPRTFGLASVTSSARARRLLRPGGEDRVVQEPVGRRRALLTHGHRRDEPVRPQVLRASYYKMSQEHQHAVARFSNLRSRKIGRDWRLTTLDISLLLHKMGRI